MNDSSQTLYYNRLPFEGVNQGEAPRESPLVIIHGLFGSGDNWMSPARKLADRRAVYMMDLPNHGRSPWTDSAAYRDAARLVDATLMDIAGSFPGDFSVAGDADARPAFSLLGHSMGGKTVMALALLQNELSGASGGGYRLDRAVVADIAPRRYDGGHEPIFEAMSGLSLDDVQTRGEVDEMLAARLPDRALRAFLLKNLMRNDDGGFSWKLNLPLLISDYEEILTWNLDGRSTVPVLFIKGGNSDYIDPERDMGKIRDLFPRAVVETVAGTGHWLHAEKPGEVLQILKNFLNT